MSSDAGNDTDWVGKDEGGPSPPSLYVPKSPPTITNQFPTAAAPQPNNSQRSRPDVVHSSAWVTLLCFLLALIAARLVVPYLVEEMRYAWHRGELRAAYEVSGDGLRNVSLDSITQAYEMVVDRVGPSVVHIDVVRTNRPMGLVSDRPYISEHPSDQGSGIVVSEDGYVLTNEHVIADGEATRVTLSDGRRFPATLVGTDPVTDLALLKINTKALIPITWGDSDQVRVGMPVWAMGSPFGLERTVTSGILSGIHRAAKAGNLFQDFMQSDAAVNPGNSGGPLVNSRGQLIGINTAIVGDTYRGVSFSIPSNVAQTVFLRLKSNGAVTRGWLGVQLEDSLDEFKSSAGARVAQLVSRDTPAAQAGIQINDVILAIDDLVVRDREDLTRRIAATTIGSEVVLKVLRGENEMAIRVRIGPRPMQ